MQYNTTLSLAVAAHMLYNDSVKDELSPVSLAFYLIDRDWMFSGEDEIYYVNSRGFIESFELEHRAPTAEDDRFIMFCVNDGYGDVYDVVFFKNRQKTEEEF